MLNENNSTMPEDFVYLKDIDPTIMQNMMYYSGQNFVGERISGYKAPCAILTRAAALALKKVQSEVKSDGYSLIVFDAYRPAKASAYFQKWGSNFKDEKMKDKFYPYISKEEIFNGYLAKKSMHSCGSTVDLTIIPINKTPNSNPKLIKRETKDGRIIPYFDDGTIDMFSNVDLLDPVSSHNCSNLIDSKYLKRRQYLKEIMERNGFQAYSKEWWHYTLNNEPYKNRYFDFDIS
uniref:D-Ala-D-Ala dipeptidase n=1 Tax=Panagrolaimus davidi TaxID=227884 RepID=A0A914P2Y5_9BILA